MRIVSNKGRSVTAMFGQSAASPPPKIRPGNPSSTTNTAAPNPISPSATPSPAAATPSPAFSTATIPFAAPVTAPSPPSNNSRPSPPRPPNRAQPSPQVFHPKPLPRKLASFRHHRQAPSIPAPHPLRAAPARPCLWNSHPDDGGAGHAVPELLPKSDVR